MFPLQCERSDFAQSMKIDRSDQNSSENYNPFEDSDEQASLLSSVNVVPKTSGDGYEVHKSAYFRGDSYTLEDTRTSLVDKHLPNVHPTPETLHYTRALGIRSTFKAERPTRIGSHFSRNISNPSLRRKVQDKLIEATSKTEMYRSNTFSDSSSVMSYDVRNISSPGSVNKNVYIPSSRPTSPFSTASSHPATPKDFLKVSPSKASTLTEVSAKCTDESIFSFQQTSMPISSLKDSGVGRPNDVCKTSPHSSTNNEAERRPNLKRYSPLNFWKKQSEVKTETKSFKNVSGQVGQLSVKNKTLECSCRLYHAHCFHGDVINSDLEARKEKRQDMILMSIQQEEDHLSEGIDNPRNIFWIPTLSFHPYQVGEPPVTFSSLWPKYKDLREHFQNSGIQKSVLSADAVFDLCTLACTCGPTHLLQCLIDLQLIRVDQPLNNGSGLLHLAVLAHNTEAVDYLMTARISPRLKDNQGLTADQVCWSSAVRKHMAPRYLLNKDFSKERAHLMPSLQDKDTIFKMASDAKYFVDIQKKLQTLDFNVNTECDNNGDFLLHIAVKAGLNQLPLIMALIKIQGADIELCNADGMTPLMLTAISGNYVLCDVLICLFGADPNKRNSLSGSSALHFAAEGNHRKCVECLIRRGADVNIEDHEGLRPDDMPSCIVATDDCSEVISSNRNHRMEMLSQLIKKDELVSSQLLPSDLSVVDSDGYTLIMTAAIYNRYQVLHCLLEVSSTTINAQHSKTGMTALSIAASLGNKEAVSVLLRHKACSLIADMSGYLPLHHAVLNNHHHTIDIILDYFPSTYVGLFKAISLCKQTSIQKKLKKAWEKRQKEIVTPKLLSCAINGDAEELFKLLEEGDNINPKSATGNWPTYLAVENGNLEVLNLLFEKGGDIRQRHPTTGATALHVAAKMGHFAIVSYLLQYCKNSHKKFTSLKVGHRDVSKVQEKYSSFSKTMRTHKERLLDINAMDRDNRTALQLAAERGFSKIVELLLSYGATSAMLDNEGNLVSCQQFEGVRIIIESHRQQHTKQIIKCIQDKKGLEMLKQIWLPRFDHNLRSKESNTPLMVAAACGNIPVLKFLLESAVYPEVSQYESESDSDTDSGVLVPLSSRDLSKDDDLQASNSSFINSLDSTSATNQQELTNSLTTSVDLFYQKGLNKILHDSTKPKGQSIYHDNLVSHVCAVNLIDGTTALHQAVRHTDATNILIMLLNADLAALNMQDKRGETILHTACRLNKSKLVEVILTQPDLDLNLRTLEGCLPEELTTSKAIKKRINKAKACLSNISKPSLERATSLVGSESAPSITGSTVNFDTVQEHYQAMKLAANEEHFS
ncbi:serine/threonine-protein phosphatase 6 regulatory ankyrin repeat subunit B-like isoform X2 [Physella acuta]|uniref:serine/threonine-protein phosphatase 6 regulatory ankyrin repeat subunit B-like isoform X2 n=1 Tax=Physella acuta TaxID=109671 RepID=UPI0027DBEC0B|nr:serine/threonine-protein phosphatase 6 regulatory ankyrin repeat subunit B-like isoform X2 [Physella acuta]XP_059173062.1 serine/threonine-protein phosphatase 6 regulatory ankyrin repeat subunit B-like isoform X2 [Physella acuta]XP_059173063.1 serine/threonine-protein phosphatase 6 regulatory ankyrin repeat subunit B-like isoform X2 [Physella acuta]